MVRIIEGYVNDIVRRTRNGDAAQHRGYRRQRRRLEDCRQAKEQDAIVRIDRRGATLVVPIVAPVALSNKGGIITLLDERGIRVHGVSYTKAQAQQPGRTIRSRRRGAGAANGGAAWILARNRDADLMQARRVKSAYTMAPNEAIRCRMLPKPTLGPARSPSVTPDDVRAAAEVIRGSVLVTELRPEPDAERDLRLQPLAQIRKPAVYSTFKERGALHRLQALSPDERRRGVIAMSAGNHAQGVAYHARLLGIRRHDRDAGRHADGEDREHQASRRRDRHFRRSTLEEVVEFAARTARSKDLTMIHPL